MPLVPTVAANAIRDGFRKASKRACCVCRVIGLSLKSPVNDNVEDGGLAGREGLG